MQGQSHARERNVLQTDPESIPLAMVQTYPIATNFQFAAQFCCNTPQFAMASATKVQHSKFDAQVSVMLIGDFPPINERSRSTPD
jgi:hypothetical protein